ncbi:hypothetical protein RJ641_036718 [Dillenia turbinata]|uniref:Uncharacterized protein n=1 Tax=Dillenia turbinata TaxID=194707 RepID=A0AAN8ZB77_9MAGN
MNLLDRSFFQDAETDEWGNISSCKMHDLMHDLAKLVAGHECSMVDQRDAGEDIQIRTRHISLNCRLTDIPSSWFNQNKLRTFLPLVGKNFGGGDEAYKALISRSGSLLMVSRPSIRRGGKLILDLTELDRLDIKGCEELDLIKDDDFINNMEIQCLKSLRTLRISEIVNRVSLPEWFQHLTSLRSLHVDSCYKLSSIPDWIVKLSSLQHLSITSCPEIRRLPERMRCLTSLQTLKVWSGECFLPLADVKVLGENLMYSLVDLNSVLTILIVLEHKWISSDYHAILDRNKQDEMSRVKIKRAMCEVKLGADLVSLYGGTVYSPSFSHALCTIIYIQVDGNRVFEITVKDCNLFIAARFFMVSHISSPEWPMITHLARRTLAENASSPRVMLRMQYRSKRTSDAILFPAKMRKQAKFHIFYSFH